MSKLIGTAPNQVPTNADLGTMAYLDAHETSIENLSVTGNITVGSPPTTSPEIGGLQVGDGWVQRSYYFGSGGDRTVTFNADFSYLVEITYTCTGNYGNGTHQARFIAGRRDWTGSYHKHAVQDLVGVSAGISVATSDSGENRTYTLTLTQENDGANIGHMIEVKIYNVANLSVY
jgi:hypothetical protein